MYPADNWHDYVIHRVEVASTRTGVSESPTEPTTVRRYRGAKNIPAGTSKCSQFLDLLLTDELLETFVSSTNSYVANQAKPAWNDSAKLTVPEMKLFFGLILYMGVVQRPEQKMYWNKDCWGDPFVRDKIKMSRNRFLAIQYNLHRHDVSQVSNADRARYNRQDMPIQFYLSYQQT